MLMAIPSLNTQAFGSTPGKVAEIDRLLDRTEPGRVDLLLDTGHYVYGGGDPVDLMARRGERIRYVHYKDLDAGKLAAIRRDRIDMRTAWRRGVFVPLGEGCIDFPELTRMLRMRDYDGWIIVEQDTVVQGEPHRPLAANRQLVEPGLGHVQEARQLNLVGHDAFHELAERTAQPAP